MPVKFSQTLFPEPIPETGTLSRLWNRLVPGPKSDLARVRGEKQLLSDEEVALWKRASEHVNSIDSELSSAASTVSSHNIEKIVGNLFPDKNLGSRITVTDQELTPPTNWRYIIWKETPKIIISTVPIDPLYWGMNDIHRLAVIKHRLRTACLCNVGTLIGLQRCNNESCFLYRNVDSVTRLDGMVKLGPEHGINSLEGKGFDVFNDTPSETQQVVMNPPPKRWFYERTV